MSCNCDSRNLIDIKELCSLKDMLRVKVFQLLHWMDVLTMKLSSINVG